MAFDEMLTQRMRAALRDGDNVSEMRMMGGACFFVRGNMVCGADRSKLGEPRFMFRVGKGNDAAAILLQGVPMALGIRTMPGFYIVDADSCGEDLLRSWLDLALAHARSLPPK